jgi:hypothetical protein
MSSGREVLWEAAMNRSIRLRAAAGIWGTLALTGCAVPAKCGLALSEAFAHSSTSTERGVQTGTENERSLARTMVIGGLCYEFLRAYHEGWQVQGEAMVKLAQCHAR